MRATECISLGWCFWHRACYGCLLCGSKSIATEAPAVKDVYWDEDEDDENMDMDMDMDIRDIRDIRNIKNIKDTNNNHHMNEDVGGRKNTKDNGRDGEGNRKIDKEKSGRKENGGDSAGQRLPRQGKLGLGGGRRKEIQDVPLCATCLVELERETGTQQLDDRVVVQKALDRIDKSDAGLSRKRWERMNTHTSRQQDDSKTCSPARFQSDGGGSSPDDDPDWEDASSHADDDDGDDGEAPLDSTIYVSMRDPINEPAFKPSPTRPIPRWMQLLWGREGPREQHLKDSQPQPSLQPEPEPEAVPRPESWQQSHPRKPPRFLLDHLLRIPERTSSNSPAAVSTVTAPGLRAARSTPSLGAA